MKSEVEEYKASKRMDLVDSSYYLGEGEHKLVNMLVSFMDSHDDWQKQEVTITTQDYAKLAGLSIDKARRTMKASLDGLWEREIVWKDEEREGRVRWLQEVGIYKDGRLTVKWSDKVFESLSSLRHSRYVQLVNKHSMVLKGGYAIRLYEILAAERYVNNWDKKEDLYRFEVNLLALQKKLAVPASYMAYKVFKPNVLTRAFKELERKDIAEVKVEEKRVGRKVDSLVFRVTWWISK